MRIILITTMLILLSSCKLETKEQKLKRVERESCELAYRYLSECAYEYKKVRVAPLRYCSKEYADRIIKSSCEELLQGLSN